MNKLLIIFVLIIAIFLFYYFFIQIKDFYVKKTGIIKINDKELQVNIADNFLKRTKGLSGKNRIENNQGMFFVFESPGIYPFWMKKMKFDIDIAWVDKDFKIIHIVENVSAKTFPKTFVSDKPGKYVLEVNAGWFDDNSIKIGDIINFYAK